MKLIQRHSDYISNWSWKYSRESHRWIGIQAARNQKSLKYSEGTYVSAAPVDSAKFSREKRVSAIHTKQRIAGTCGGDSKPPTFSVERVLIDLRTKQNKAKKVCSISRILVISISFQKLHALMISKRLISVCSNNNNNARGSPSQIKLFFPSTQRHVNELYEKQGAFRRRQPSLVRWSINLFSF